MKWWFVGINAMYLFLANIAIGHINKFHKQIKEATCGFVFDLLSWIRAQSGATLQGRLREWRAAKLRISAIVDACFRLIVDGVSEPSWTRRGCAQARG